MGEKMISWFTKIFMHLLLENLDVFNICQNISGQNHHVITEMLHGLLHRESLGMHN